MRNTWYEGCFTEETLVRANGKDVIFKELVDISTLQEGFNDIIISVDTLGATTTAKIFFAGEKQCTKIEWDGGHFEGADHPVMVLEDCALYWKKIEDIKIGDCVLKIA